MPEKIRFGIVGCGGIGPTHAGALSQIADAQLVAVCDSSEERARRLAEVYPGVRVYASLDEMIAQTDIDAFCVCTPSGLHADHAIAVLKANKHAFVEKPMDVSLAACDQMNAAQKTSDKVLAIVSQHRFDRASRIVRDAIQSDRLGAILFAHATVHWWRTQAYYDSGDWRGTWKFDGGGALMNQGVHTVDLLQWLTGDIVSVYAQTRISAHENIEVEDIAALTLSFANGAIGTITATTAAFPGFPVSITICGSEGTAIIEGDRLKLLTFKNGESFDSEAAAAHAVSVAQGGTASVRDQSTNRMSDASADPGAIWGDAHKAQLEDFIAAIRNGNTPMMDGIEGRKPVAVILAAYRSARAGLPVTV